MKNFLWNRLVNLEQFARWTFLATEQNITWAYLTITGAKRNYLNEYIIKSEIEPRGKPTLRNLFFLNIGGNNIHEYSSGLNGWMQEGCKTLDEAISQDKSSTLEITCYDWKYRIYYKRNSTIRKQHIKDNAILIDILLEANIITQEIVLDELDRIRQERELKTLQATATTKTKAKRGVL